MNISKKAKKLVGQVVSDKMDKTLTVVIDRVITHKLYKKSIKRRTKLHVHDEKNAAKIGDRVVIQESRPYSKTKSWLLVSIEKAIDI